jgi:hypothetical protein
MRPTFKTLLLALLGALVSGGACAQMYKIVGPDGKISYSDRPPTDANAKVSVMKGGQAAAPETPKTLANNPGLVAGIATVLDTSEIVTQNARACAQLPTAKAYDGAKESWAKRNADILAQHRRVFEALYSDADRLSLQKSIGDRVGKSLHQAAGNNEASRTKWCDKSMEQVRSGKMDLAGKEGIDALMKFKKP